jgi:molecular chaperone DnaJ
MTVKDPYEVLGVGRNASTEEIKAAYRRLARRFHPDVNPGDPSAEEKFKEIGAAYAVLSDPERKARFDRFGTTEDVPAGDFFGGAGGFGDLMDMFFGGMGGGANRRRTGRDGEDIRADVTLTLSEVLTGVRKEIPVTRDVECTTCNGTGSEAGTAPETCGNCRGAGVVSTVRSMIIGQVRTQMTCPNCQGEGTVTKNPCRNCRGRKLVEETSTVSVNIPAGVDSGTTIQVPGQGCDGTGTGRPGDLYVVLDVDMEGRFERRGTHLFTQMELSFAQAALGDQVEIRGIDEGLELEVPAGTQPGTALVVRGAGLPPLHGGKRGDIYVQANVRVPEDLSEAQVKLIRELAELGGETLPKGPKPGGFLGGLFGKRK